MDSTSMLDAVTYRLAAAMYARGYSPYEISAELNMPEAEVRAILAQIREEWEREAREDFTYRMAMELKKLEQLERTAWEAYELSKQAAARKKTVERGVGATTGKEYCLEKVEEEQLPAGDHRYLDVIKWAIERRIEILGLSAPKRAEVFTASIDMQALAEALGSGERLQSITEVIKQIRVDKAKMLGAAQVIETVSDEAEVE